MYFYWLENDSLEGHLTTDVSSVSKLAVMESIQLATLLFVCGRNNAIDYDIILSKEKQLVLRPIIADILNEMETVGHRALEQSSAPVAAVVRCLCLYFVVELM